MSFDYDEAFSRNVGFVTAWEQQLLRAKRVAVAGAGGVGGAHVLTLARLGVGALSIADLDTFEVANFNRQIGAMTSTVNRAKVDVIGAMARDINPTLDIRSFPRGVGLDTIDEFLSGAELFIDGLDFFELQIRSAVFARCAELGIPAVTAAPLGFGSGYIAFMPGKMTFEQFFRLSQSAGTEQYGRFLIGLAPSALHGASLVDRSRLDLARHRGPSTTVGCQLAAGAAGALAIRILLERGGVASAPWYHQYDAYAQRFVRRKLRGGNQNIGQRAKLALLKHSAPAMIARAWPADEVPAASDLEAIVAVARWTPSGDNHQPWRFELHGDDTIVVRVTVDQTDLYDFDGRATEISAGMLLESIRLAAADRGRELTWQSTDRSPQGFTLTLRVRQTGIGADTLGRFVKVRSVDRRPFRTARLDMNERAALEAACGSALNVRFAETLSDKLRHTVVNARSTLLRLRIREAYDVHRRVVDFEHRFSPDGVPAESLGLDPFTLAVLRWGMKSWERTEFLNKRVGGHAAAALQMDVVPGVRCGAHFSLALAPGSTDDLDTRLVAGMHVQRFWLVATSLGLALQPAFAPLSFAHYARTGTRFTSAESDHSAAQAITQELDRLAGGDASGIVYRGRIGHPTSHGTPSRSARLPTGKLIVTRPHAAPEPELTTVGVRGYRS